MIRTTRQRRISAWLIPLAYSAAGVVAGLWSHRLARVLLPGYVSDISVAAAIGVYSSVASGMIALTAIVFSLTFLMVQFSASTYSPRLVFWIASDRVTSHALGVFTATFLYALIALAWVDRGGSGRVPMMGVALGTALLVASVCMFVSLTQRLSTLDVSRVLSFTADQAREVIDRLYPPIETLGPASLVDFDTDRCVRTILHHGRPQNVQAVDAPRLIQLASGAQCVIEVAAAIGDAVLDSMPLARIHGGRGPLPEKEVKRAIALGGQRAFEQDPKYAIRLLVDIAIRALSPAINDPTTAVQALDQIGDLLVRLGRRRLETGVFRDGSGQVRVVMPVPSWDDYVRLAFVEILSCGATSVQVMRRMNALVSELTAALPGERRPALAAWRERIHATIERTFPHNEDRLDALAEDQQGLGSPRRQQAPP